MADPIKEFLVSLGFSVDAAAQAKIEAAQKQTEARLTAATEAGAKQRVDAEAKSSSARSGLMSALARVFGVEEQALADKREKIRQKDAERDNRTADDLAKRARDRRTAAVKQMQQNVVQLASFATRAVAAVEATALGVVYAADKAAKSFERLNYASRLFGSTPAGMTAAGYAAGQLGSSAEAMNATLASFGDRLRTYPGQRATLSKLLGKPVTDAKGDLRDTSDLLADLGDKLREYEKQGQYGHAKARAYANAYGVDDLNIINAIEDPRYRQLMQEQRRRAGAIGADPNAAAAGGAAFEQSMRRLRDVVNDIATKVNTGIFDKLTPALERLSTWGEQHGKDVADIISRIMNDLLKLATEVINQLAQIDWNTALTRIEKFANDFDALAKKFFGDSGTVTLAFGAFGLVIANQLMKPLTAVLETLGAIGRLPLIGRLLGGLALSPAGLAVGGAALVGAVLASGDPSKALLGGGHPDLGPRDNDLGLPGLENEDLPENRSRSDAGAAKRKITGLWDWLKGKAKDYGFGDKLSGDPVTRDAIIDTAAATKKLVDLAEKNAGGGGGGGGFAGGQGGGASLGDRIAHGSHHLGGGGWRGNYGQKGWWTDERQSHAVDYLMKNAGLTEDGAKALVARWRYVESPGGPTAVNPSSGAEGIAQWLGGRKGDGSNGSFDEQLGKVARELNGSEGRAKRLLNTAGSEARGASAFERAEGWNSNTNTDNFTGRVQEGMKHIVHGVKPAPAPAAAPRAMAPAPAGTSAKAINDAEIFAARQRLANGGNDPKDRALIQEYLRQQNTAKGAKTSFLADHLHRVALGVPKLGHPLGVSPMMAHMIDNSRTRGDQNVTHNPVFNIHGGDTRVAMDQARIVARRGTQDLLRNLQTMES